MPGHGGVLDRLDSVIFVAPIVFLFYQIFLCFIKKEQDYFTGYYFTATVLLLSVLIPCGLQAALQIGAFDINNHFTILETQICFNQ
jgi:hypothetical protein